MSDRKKILITGAAGFIGARIVEVFHSAGYHQVRAGVRSMTSCPRIARYPVEIVKADVLSRQEIESAVKDISVVIHCAYGGQGATEEGTENLLSEALKAGVKHVIHLSTIEVYSTPHGVVDENFTCELTGEPYGDSKLKAEQICVKYSEKGLPVTILRLPIVYGPFSRNWTVNMAIMLINRELGLYDGIGEGKCNLLYIDDLVRAIRLSMERQNKSLEILNINGPDILTWNEYIRQFNMSLGLPPLKRIKQGSASLKVKLMSPVRLFGGYVRDNHMEKIKFVSSKFSFANHIMRKIEKKLKYTPAASHFKLFATDAVFDCQKARVSIGYMPKYSVEEGLRLTSSWLKHHKFVG